MWRAMLHVTLSLDVGQISPGFKVKSDILIMHFLLNRGTYQLQTLQVRRSYDVEGTGQRFVLVLGLRSRSK